MAKPAVELAYLNKSVLGRHYALTVRCSHTISFTHSLFSQFFYGDCICRPVYFMVAHLKDIALFSHLLIFRKGQKKMRLGAHEYLFSRVD